MIDLETVFRRCSDVRFRSVGDEGIVLRQEEGEVIVVNEVGARTLDMINAKTPVGGLIDLLSDVYDGERSTFEKDITAYLQELAEAGIIEVKPSQQMDAG